ncbi:DUF3280 domain-containing protein [Fulvimarina sp. 2208YS6-2-32]|uniref:DUF3280 domain-containing protein n=1 Tax=Fulvimarina uroteuthidis TaxID=3098149 RepID=A0ABU5HXJ8_9HYPH|nr:DUF3280 domain-containing protein [Fulvimarina sp. 2208YS6-2-32]MDY8107867.1 DUF3280 domain-containing protein [Fulvimarina sp. 2208YS6-2-32]
MVEAHVLGGRKARQAGFFPVVVAAIALMTTASLAQEPAASAPDTNAAAIAQTQRVAVFPFELVDSSLEGSMMGVNADETKRLAMMAPAMRKNFETLDGFEVMDSSAADEKVANVHLESCGNCGVTFARDLGADVVVLGTVQKVSNLILNINAYVYDVASGEQIARGSADIRSNTDKSWQKGLEYLFENVLKTQIETRS